MAHKIVCALCAAGAALLAQTAMADDNNGNSFKLGVEGFYDEYREDVVSVDNKAGYGSITGTYSHDFDGVFGAIDGRVSYGMEQYNSPDGSDGGIPQWEYDLRGRGGVNLVVGDGTLSPYVGLGLRYYVDESKNTVTTRGFVGYDRRITQFYAPIGVTYTTNINDSWYVAPNAEFDPLLHGNVNTRLQNDGFYNLNSVQHSGYGLRGELMFGQKAGGYNNMSWEVGPFVRYWNIKDSDVTTAPDSSQWIEPANTRWQIGAALRALW